MVITFCQFYEQLRFIQILQFIIYLRMLTIRYMWWFSISWSKISSIWLRLVVRLVAAYRWLAQHCAMELPESCTKPSISYVWLFRHMPFWKRKCMLLAVEISAICRIYHDLYTRFSVHCFSGISIVLVRITWFASIYPPIFFRVDSLALESWHNVPVMPQLVI